MMDESCSFLSGARSRSRFIVTYRRNLPGELSNVYRIVGAVLTCEAISLIVEPVLHSVVIINRFTM